MTEVPSEVPSRRGGGEFSGWLKEPAGLLAAGADTAPVPGGYAVKTDYLALGKGVLITDDLDEAILDARAKLEHGTGCRVECSLG